MIENGHISITGTREHAVSVNSTGGGGVGVGVFVFFWIRHVCIVGEELDYLIKPCGVNMLVCVCKCNKVPAGGCVCVVGSKR